MTEEKIEAPRRRARVPYKPGASTESVEDMMKRLYRDFPKDMAKLAD